MKLNQNILAIADSITLAFNDEAIRLAKEGQTIYNLTAGQLPFRPDTEFLKCLVESSQELKSYQYSPGAGFLDLRQKITQRIAKLRGVSIPFEKREFDCVLSNGAKQSIYNAIGAIVNPSEEVIILAPYWTSYPEIVKLWGGIPRIINCSKQDLFIPSLELIEKNINTKTKCIMLNSPNNPSGVYYSKEWMAGFANLLEKHPNIFVLSDEIYYDLCYTSGVPSYFYQENPKLLERTIIIDGISKTLASTGLRLGYAIAEKSVAEMMTRIQVQTTSGPNSLVQVALLKYDFSRVENFLKPALERLRENVKILRESFIKHELSSAWYEPTSAFYFMLDLSQTPFHKKLTDQDMSLDVSLRLLKESGVAVVPGIGFGLPNTLRLSLIVDKEIFVPAVQKIMQFLSEP